jgi:hypothetical protein
VSKRKRETWTGYQVQRADGSLVQLGLMPGGVWPSSGDEYTTMRRERAQQVYDDDDSAVRVLEVTQEVQS